MTSLYSQVECSKTDLIETMYVKTYIINESEKHYSRYCIIYTHILSKLAVTGHFAVAVKSNS